VHVVKGDITSLAQLQDAAKTIESVTGGGLDVLINNGAYIENSTFDFLPTTLSDPSNLPLVTSAFHKSVDTNVLGAIFVTNTFLPLILKGKQKKIVHISSAMGDAEFVRKAGVTGAVGYSASKAMLNLVVAKFAVELGEKGVNVVALSPGWVDTAEVERKYYFASSRVINRCEIGNLKVRS
jgi:NAD(P)-dependent dehydrogenase (short-subunit alcohol dehydrogenase family)